MLTLAVIAGTRQLAAGLVADPSTSDVLGAMEVHERGDARVHRSPVAAGEPLPGGTRLAAITARRSLRVGYLSDALPFAFFNARGELVGLDVALMHRLAIELDARLEFVPVGREALDRHSGVADLLRRGYCDIVIGGIAVTTRRAGFMQLSSSYLDETLGFVVHDAIRREFDSWESIQKIDPLTVAMPDVDYYVEKLRGRLPRARFRTVPTIERLFDPRTSANAIALPAERGSAWTLRYPQYSVVVPTAPLIKIPLAFAMPRSEPELGELVNTWIDLKRKDGTIDELYQYWILGRSRSMPHPRWSIIRDVLHWVE
jgi:ABC-type amino acid transport substrate-binding protein